MQGPAKLALIGRSMEIEEDLFQDSHVIEGPDAAQASQDEMTAEIRDIHSAYRRGVAAGQPEETQPRRDFAPYRSSILRHPTKDLHHTDPETIELWSPAFGHQDVHALESDLTIAHSGEPLGERIIVTGRVLDGAGRPVRNQLVEVWQANSAGRYITSGTSTRHPLIPTSPALDAA